MRRPIVQIVAAIVACVLLLAPVAAVAQGESDSTDEVVEPTNEQSKLNAEAVGAIQDGDYDKAVKLLEASNALGEMNVIWLNLGRAYQKLGRCKKARAAYLSVISAPAVADPSPRLINAKADQYLGELDKECDRAKAAEEKTADAGKDEATDADAKAVAEANKDTSEEDTSVDKPEPVEPQQSSNALGWTLTATGIVLAGVGVGGHFWAQSIRDDVTSKIDGAENGVVDDMTRQQALDNESRANVTDTVAVSAIVTGAVVAGTGAYLLLTSDAAEAAPAASVSASGDVTFGFSGRF